MGKQLQHLNLIKEDLGLSNTQYYAFKQWSKKSPLNSERMSNNINDG